MPLRFLRPGITTSERWNACSFEAQSFYIRLLTLVDDFGRYDARIPILRNYCFPLRDDITCCQLTTLVGELLTNGLVVLYTTDGQEVVQIARWKERVRNKESRFPDPPTDDRNPPTIDSKPPTPDNKCSPPTPSPSPSPTPSPTPPPTVPQGGHDEVVGLDEAKRIICSDILKGKNPARPWSYEATEELSRLLPIPRGELRLLAWFHGLAADAETPELRDRRRSETTLVRFWSDEVTRAAAFRQKIRGGIPERKKAEPELWRDFFWWKYGQDVHLPARFEGLGRDQIREWEAEHEAFEVSRKQEVTA